jgi:NAD(P) transhydrogenase
VHCIGETATEIVHVGQTVMAYDGTIDYFRDAVFNYPTMTECYKVAAFDGLNKLCLGRIADAALVRHGSAAPIAGDALEEALTDTLPLTG